MIFSPPTSWDIQHFFQAETYDNKVKLLRFETTIHLKVNHFYSYSQTHKPVDASLFLFPNRLRTNLKVIKFLLLLMNIELSGPNYLHNVAALPTKLLQQKLCWITIGVAYEKVGEEGILRIEFAESQLGSISAPITPLQIFVLANAAFRT
ncbi:hypothetical protein OIU84_018491 [Salix udensis]|uniref:Uncharacterized protein n=1 Tax=Salix udensis TaxID=889485 RepID=A0AAD6PIG2_9ROSI|nr:hypothetical protein OIU84_018491 [Salix udensis]